VSNVNASPSNIIDLAVPYAPLWEEPDMKVLDGFRSATPELPLQVFGPLSNWLSQAAEAKNAPVDYVATTLLVVAASLIGNSLQISPWAGWTESSILAAALVGLPSSGKSPAMDAIMSPLRALEKELQAGYATQKKDYALKLEISKREKELWEKDVRGAKELKTGYPELPDSAIEPEKPSLVRLVTNDATIEALGTLLKQNPRGILNARDELAGWLENMGRYSSQGSDRSFWIEAFGGRSYTFDRKHQAEPLVIERLNISILGGIQPDRLANVLLSGDDDGLAARFLYVWPKSTPPKRPNSVPDETFILTVLRRLHSISLEEDPRILMLTQEAADTLQDFRNDLYELEPEVNGILLGHLGKLRGITLKIALVLEMLWWACSSEYNQPMSVSNQAIESARELITAYFLPMARKAFGDAALPEPEKNASALAKWIFKKKESTINVRKLYRNRIVGLSDATSATAAIIELVEFGWLQPKPTRSGDQPGRQKSDYIVNPRIWEELHPIKQT